MIAAAANLAWFASHAGAARRFSRQLRNPDATQAGRLQELLQRHATSAFGRLHGFAGIRSAAEFSARVPLSTYDDLEPWIDRIRQGESAVLTSDPVTHLVPTSGSSSACKLIPFTAGLQREFDAAIGAWIADLYGRHPASLLGPSYWSISPALQDWSATPSRVPIGFDDDTRYLGGLRRRLVAATLATPSALRLAGDMETFLLATLVCLLRRKDLRLISVWHPSFLLLLLDALPRHWAAVLAILRTGQWPKGSPLPAALHAALRLRPEPGRTRELERLGPTQPGEFWPRLAVISCWTDAHAALAAATVAKLFPRATLQSKGLLATEAFVSLPFAGAHPLAVGSHYFEFIAGDGSLRAAGQLELNGIYEVVVTTGGGLWRYRLGDRVQVDGFVARTPSLRFVGRAGQVSDLFGEKLSDEFVTAALRELSGPRAAPARFAMLAPDSDGHSGGYTLYWEGEAPPAPAALEQKLSANPHYAWCRQLGQLRPARVSVVEGGATAAYLQRVADRGVKPGDAKPPALAVTTDWAGCFRLKPEA
jgi:GH3 auxin-responsive promoter